MNGRILKCLTVVLMAGAMMSVMTGCEINSGTPTADTADLPAGAVTNSTTANLEGVWNFSVNGGIRNLAGGIVIDSHGNVTGLTGPTNVTGMTGSFYVGSNGQDVNGNVNYHTVATNGVAEEDAIFFLGRFVSTNQISGNHTYSWSPGEGGNYQTGTFTMSR